MLCGGAATQSAGYLALTATVPAGIRPIVDRTGVLGPGRARGSELSFLPVKDWTKAHPNPRTATPPRDRGDRLGHRHEEEQRRFCVAG